MPETIVIGDMHGHADALRGLIDKILPRVHADTTIVTLGDYIDRGPSSRDVIDQLLNLKLHTSGQLVSLLGNHEDWMLQSLNDHTKHPWLLGMDGLSTIQSYSSAAAAAIRDRLTALGPRIYTERVSLPYDLFFDTLPDSHLRFFQELQVCYEDQHGFYSHAGLDPLYPLSEQNRQVLVWGEHTNFQCYSGKPVVYGHWNNMLADDGGNRVPRRAGDTYGIDSIADGVLTALHLPSLNVTHAQTESV
ncbi:metallophosphoesterase [Fuerstiella marisgermanici]|uniref:Calcineurin-like phosphoesterase domain-containing protein n=1 Tax=Fuerstiella marisgermanici TaxID=1891926 RepID=A0A1P8WQT4_9PLAN|nr:metallophosphoesterase [Fuerstiella marisgermanici]APZ96421.1 putative protein phosphatase [Fuerstiella marisgermanici]